ncbi:MAG: VWA domain-containing protein [Alphaproteobacteria bacterium]|nr:VWA domain-containing protein [Alphaproteobacteria bacterium]
MVGRLADNVMHFVRALRAAGLPIGPGRTIEALRAVEAVGVGRREDFYWTLHATLVNRRDQRAVFDQAFHIFWKDPQLLEKMMSLLLPRLTSDELPNALDEASQRVKDALAPQPVPGPGEETAPSEIRVDAALTYSDRERLQDLDFEDMTAAEERAARRIIAQLRFPIEAVRTRRTRPDRRGRRIDLRASLRASLRTGGASIPLARRAVVTRHPPIVALCDISGSMERYSRMLLHFLHALTNDRDRVHSFVFGTRLTNVTRHLRHKDVDIALAKASKAVADWSGGTRIGKTLFDFNRLWSRRVMGQGPLVLLISDGLDQAAGEGLGEQMARLKRSCRRLIWLNPLLRYEGFEPKSMGVRAMLPHVDEFRPVHNLKSLAELANALGRERVRGESKRIAS